MLFNLLASAGLMWILRFGSIFNKPRSAVVKSFPVLKGLIDCSMCLGFWTGLLVAYINFYFNQISFIELILFPFASSGFCWFFDSVLELAQLSLPKTGDK